MSAAGEPASKKAKTGSMLDKETVLLDGYDGKKTEYCPYDETSKDYDGTRAPLGLHLALGGMVMSAKPLKEQHILDVGCGTGTFMKAVKDKVGKVSGVEYNDGMLAQAKALLGDGPVHLVQGSADSLKFEDASFDAVAVNQVIHHFPQDDNYAFCLRSFKEIYRVLKPGGVFVLNTSTPEQQRDAFWWLSLFPKASEAICARFPPLDVLKAHLTASNFVFDAETVKVPLHRSLMAEDKYLEHGVKGGFMKEYRSGDSSWSMAENSGELEEGLKKLQDMIDQGSSDFWLEGREKLRKSIGQATFLTVRKPLA